MATFRCAAGIFLICALVLNASAAPAQSSAAGVSQTYPNKPIRVVTGEPGGSTHFAARLIAQGISGGLGQNIIVESRPSRLLGEYVAKAQPDGYTVLVAGGTFVMGPLLQKMPYDPVHDFAPVTMATNSPNVLVIYPSVAAASVKELIALSKAKPGSLNYASGGAGSTSHLAAELFKSMAGVDIVRIQYKGNGPALNDLLGGQVQVMFSGASLVAGYIKSSRLRALASTSAAPTALFPGLPTIAAAGLPGYESGTSNGVYVPAKTPAAIVNRLNQEIVRFLSTPDVREKLLSTGVEAAPNSPREFAAKIKSEITVMGGVIKSAGITVE